MLELVYVSAARRPFDEGQLAALLAQARAKNARLGVVGILLYDHGSFLQVLQGEESTVMPLFETIARDARHERVSVLQRNIVQEASFGAWTMGFVSLATTPLPSRHALRSNGTFEGTALEVLAVLDHFREGQWRQYIRG
ncbi:MAG TPA: BLUF domain-containing protein [Polyangiales bacterium]|nr:BLUF domain-containing protein [Polyangiales bacterium]